MGIAVRRVPACRSIDARYEVPQRLSLRLKTPNRDLFRIREELIEQAVELRESASRMFSNGHEPAARNVELKARVDDPAETEVRARALADQGPIDLLQDDTFFVCSNGRLKLRELAPDLGEVIFYRRPDVHGPKLCFYTRASTPAPALMRAALTDALGVVGRVRKRRRLYLAGPTRIHLDDVDGLGSYLELEVVLADSQSVSEGEAVARGLLSRLGIDPAQLVAGAYIDLLHAQGGAP